MARFKLKKPKLENKEAAVLDSVQHYLALNGWTHLRIFPGLWVPWNEVLASKHAGFMPKPRRLHENDLPDLLAVKAASSGSSPSPQPGAIVVAPAGLGWILWIEIKRPGERPTEAQERKHDELRRAGFVVIWADGLAEGEGEEPFMRSYRKFFGG